MPLPTSKGARIRAGLAQARLLLAVGAHDALSAKLVEEAGFDAVWASGFGISAVSGVPDANILTMTENLDAVKRMSEAVDIPVIADCDTGYGNAINVMRAVHEYERTGAAGICLEDNVFPKRCSFYAGVQRELVPVEEHARKIEAAKAAQRDRDFIVVARTEALIAARGLDEALHRAKTYAAAGADGVLVHSKAPTFAELAAFGRAWNGTCPLVAVPTTYPDVTAEELLEAGFRLAIFANQPLRAAIPAMRAALRAMSTARKAGVVEKHIAPLEEIYELVGVPELKQSEQRYLVPTNSTRAIIIAAGFEEQLMPLISDRPKGMLNVGGETILARQVRALRAAGITDIAVVRGYRKDAVNLPGLRYFDNDQYEESGELESLFRAQAAMTGRFVFLYSDILFEQSILERLLRADADIAVVADRSWYDTARLNCEPPPARADLVITSCPPVPHRRFVADEGGCRVLRIGQHLPPGAAHAEFIGIVLFSARGAELMQQIFREAAAHSHGRFHEAESITRATVTDLLQEIIDQGHEVTCIDIHKGWIEIDSLDDYRRACAEVNGEQSR